MKKKVLHILSSNGFAGAENVAMCIINNLSENYEFAYTSPMGSIEKTLQSREITYMPMEKLSIVQIRKIIHQWEPDIIHAHDFTATIKSLLASFTLPVVSHIHQNPAWLRRVNAFSILFFLACLKVKKIIVVSPVIKESTFMSGLFNKKTKVIKNIVDLKWIAEKAVVPSEKRYDIAFIGRFEEVKDPLRFIRIISQVVKKHPQVKVVMMGEGSLQGQLEALIREEKLTHNIDIQAFLLNPFPILKNTKMLMMTSKSEGLPMVVIEALALGKPVLVPQLEGIENIVDRSCGLICQKDIEFVDGVVRLLNSNDDYVTMSANAVKKANEMFNMDDYEQQFTKVYNSVL